MTIPERIASRLHVGATRREVIAAVRARINRKHRRAFKARSERKIAYRQALACHEENRRLYALCN